MRLPSYRDFSLEQDKIYNLPLTTNYLVTGPPGTGKTVIALYRASMYAKQQRTPVLLMRSKVLAGYTGTAAQDLGIAGTIATYNSWVGKDYWRKFKEYAPQLEPFVFDWSKMLPRLIEASLTDKNKPCLLIDEGQDLPAEFYTSALFMADRLTVFADENQRITKTQSTFEEIRSRSNIKTEHKLTRNYRNSREIAELAACFYAGLPTGKPDLPERKGNQPVVQKTPGLDAAMNIISTFESNNSHLVIGVFTQNIGLQDQIKNKLKGKTKNPVESYKNSEEHIPDFNKPGIKLIQFESAKGLEFDAVFIPEVNTISKDPEELETKMLFYVLLSRAREQLFLTYSGQNEPSLLKLFPRQLVEWRM
jgi:DNA helicase IV